MTPVDYEITERVSRLLRDYLKATGTTGVALAVWRDGRPFLSVAEGLASREAELPMTSSTLFGAGSITKTLTALTFLLLERDGLLSLDDPAERYLPELGRDIRLILEPRPDKRIPLLLRHLLSHTSGIPELGLTVSLFFRLCGVEGQGPYEVDDPGSLLAGLLDFARVRYRRPGARFLYSNENYVLLARIAELAAGKPFAEIVRERVLLPLGMFDSSIGLRAGTGSAPRITGYVPSASGPRPVPLAVPEAAYGPGGLVATVDDLGRYLAFLLGRGELGGLGIAGYATSLWTGIRAGDEVAGRSYGLGWYVQEGEFDEPLIYHGGDILYSGGICAVLPRRGAGVVVGQNAAGSPSLAAFARAVLRLLAGDGEEPGKTGPDAALSAGEIAGAYRSQGGTYALEAYFERGILRLRPESPGSGAGPELAFAASRSAGAETVFEPADYPPSPRRGSCAFVRGGGDEVWLRYEHCLFKKSRPGS